MTDTMFGMTAQEVAEIKRWRDENNYADMMKDLATLRAKVSYYEAYIQRLNEFMQTNLEIKN